MYRAIPVPNKICAYKNREYSRAKHLYQLSNMRSQIDYSQPETMGLHFLVNRKKKEKILEERYQEIDRENKILLEKITNIMQKPNSKFNSSMTSFQSQQQSVFKPQQQPLSYELGQRNIKSLNKGSRKRQLVKISIENLAFLKRLSTQSSCYKTKSFAKDRANNLKYLSNICEFPPIITETSKSASNKRFILRPATETQNLPQVYKSQQSDLQKPATSPQKLVIYQNNNTIIGDKEFECEIFTDNEFKFIFSLHYFVNFFYKENFILSQH